MKKREIQELKNVGALELEKRLRDAREKLRALKFDLAAGKVKNIFLLHTIKRDIARYLTFIARAK